MRRKTVLKNRVYVRRSAPGPAALIALFTAIALGAFVFFARPAINRLAVDLSEAPVSSERVTRDISFGGMPLYLVELTRVADAADARIEAARYVPRGAAGYVYPDPSGEFYLVFGAGYGTKLEAERVAAGLIESEGIDAKVHAFTAEEVRMRVTATEAQLTSLAQSEEALSSLTSALGAHALSLDRGEAEPAGLRAAIALEAEQATGAMDRLTRAAGDAPNQVAGALIAQLSALEGACRRLAESTGDTALTMSSKLKYAHIDARLAHIAFLNSLS